MSSVREFGAVGDGRADDTEAIRHAVAAGDGTVRFPKGTYRVSGTIAVELARTGRIAIAGEHGVAKIVMTVPGPVFHLKGTHDRSAAPEGFRPQVWEKERMPTVSGLEIEGAHADADGLLFEGVMQPTITGVLIREVRTPIRFAGRARNVLIDGCHLFHNRGIGIHFDAVNLHQIIVSASHISYCRLGGIRIDGACEIRNFQITGCDIEYNNFRSHPGVGEANEPTAEVFIDARNGTIREGTITGCTVQATDSENGANVRMLGSVDGEPGTAGMWAVTGNLIGSQRDNVHLNGAAGVSITGNFLYSGHRRNILVERSASVAIAGNSFGHNQDYDSKQLRTGIRIVDSADVSISGAVLRDAAAGRHTVDTEGPSERMAPLELVRCRRVTVSGTQILDGAPNGIYVEDCSDTVITGCTVLEDRSMPLMTAAVRWVGETSGSLVDACRLGKGSDAALVAPESVTRGTIV